MLADDETIRLATLSDAEELSRHVYISPDVLNKKVDANEFIVAVGADQLLGFVQLEYLWSKVPYIALVRVVPEYRRRGIGRAMIDFLERSLSAVGHETIYSSSQADEPEPQAWHRHVGFEECGMIKEISNGVDEIFFRKTISKA